MTITGRVEVGPEPRGVVLDQGGKTAFVAVGVANEVARVDLETPAASPPGWPSAESREGSPCRPTARILLVGNARSQDVSVISTRIARTSSSTIPIDGDNLRQVAISADGKSGYVANMKNRGFATTSNNIDLGWVLGQRLTRVALDALGLVRHALARPAGQGRGRRPRRGRQQGRQIPGGQSAAARTR